MGDAEGGLERELVRGPKRASRMFPKARWRWSFTRVPRARAWSAAMDTQAYRNCFFVGGGGFRFDEATEKLK